MTVVTIGAMFGPAQGGVASRRADFLFAGRPHPLWIARSAMIVVLMAFGMLAPIGISFPVAALFVQALAPFVVASAVERLSDARFCSWEWRARWWCSPV